MADIPVRKGDQKPQAKPETTPGRPQQRQQEQRHEPQRQPERETPRGPMPSGGTDQPPARTEEAVLQTTAHPIERTRRRRVVVPATDIYEQDDALVVLADMPGVDEGSVELNVENRVLSIHGRVDPETFAGQELTWQEYEVGDFERSFTLPEEVAVDKIEATVKQGVLRVVLPKAQAARPRKIQVKAG